MATRESIAIKASESMARIENAARTYGQSVGKQYPSLPTQGKDRDLVHANQLAALADMVEDILAMQSKFVKEGE